MARVDRLAAWLQVQIPELTEPQARRVSRALLRARELERPYSAALVTRDGVQFVRVRYRDQTLVPLARSEYSERDTEVDKW